MANNKGKSRARYYRKTGDGNTGGGAKISNGVKAAIIALTSLLLAATLTIVAAVGSYGFRESDYKKWFGRGNNVSIEKPDDGNQAEVKSWGKAIDDVGNVLDSEVTYAMPQAIAFMSDVPEAAIATAAYEAPSVTVTARPTLPLTKVEVDWTVTYPDGSDASSAVTITPNADDSNTATLKCLAPFSQQITLSAAAKDSSGLVGTATVDYIKRIASVEEVAFNTSTALTTDSETELKCTVAYSTGTVYGDFVIDSLTMELESDFYQMVTDKLVYMDLDNWTPEYNLATEELITEDDIHFRTDGSVVSGMDAFTKLLGNYDTALPDEYSSYSIEDKHKAIQYAWNQAYKEYHAQYNKANVNGYIECSLRSGNTVLQKYTAQVTFAVNADFYGIPENAVPTNGIHMSLVNKTF